MHRLLFQTSQNDETVWNYENYLVYCMHSRVHCYDRISYNSLARRNSTNRQAIFLLRVKSLFWPTSVILIVQWSAPSNYDFWEIFRKLTETSEIYLNITICSIVTLRHQALYFFVLIFFRDSVIFHKSFSENVEIQFWLKYRKDRTHSYPQSGHHIWSTKLLLQMCQEIQFINSAFLTDTSCIIQEPM